MGAFSLLMNTIVNDCVNISIDILVFVYVCFDFRQFIRIYCAVFVHNYYIFDGFWISLLCFSSDIGKRLYKHSDERSAFFCLDSVPIRIGQPSMNMIG